MQNEKQCEAECHLLAMADELGGRQGLNRPRFFQNAAGMAASFVAERVLGCDIQRRACLTNITQHARQSSAAYQA
jgi:hypothetical protein